MFEALDKDERLRLMRFVCSFAWADLEIQAEERAFIGGLVRSLGFGPEERQKVEQWLQIPPSPEEVDPQEIPMQHRHLFLGAVRALISSDHHADPAEMETYQLLEQLVR